MNRAARARSRCTRKPRRAVLGLLIWTVAGCASPPGECADIGATSVVVSGQAGEWHDREVESHLVELWRVGGLTEGQELAYPASLAVSAEGVAAIPDFQLAEVAVVGPDGQWSRWGRRGDGPGEFSAPVAISFAGDGTLAVFDIGAGRVVFMREGAVARESLPVASGFTAPVLASGELEWAGVQPDGATLLKLLGRTDADGSREEAILRLPAGAAAPDTIASTRVPVLDVGAYRGVRLPGHPFLRAAVSPEGMVATATEAAYRIDVHDAAGRPVRVLCREVRAEPVAPRERAQGDDEVPAELRAALAAAPAPERPAAFGRMFWSTEGRLWVQRERPAPLGDWLGVEGAHYDVFDEGGAFLGSVSVPPRARLQAASGDRVWALETGELGETWVVAYRLVERR